jgi:hypothetical protein
VTKATLSPLKKRVGFKVFAEGIRQAFELNRTEMRVFYKVLEVYEQEKMTGGFADSITLFWFNDTLNGQSVDMSDRTFQNYTIKAHSWTFLLNKFNQLSVAVLDFQACLVQ